MEEEEKEELIYLRELQKLKDDGYFKLMLLMNLKNISENLESISNSLNKGNIPMENVKEDIQKKTKQEHLESLEKKSQLEENEDLKNIEEEIKKRVLERLKNEK